MQRARRIPYFTYRKQYNGVKLTSRKSTYYYYYYF